MADRQSVSRRRFLGTGMAVGSAVLLAPGQGRAAEGDKDDIRCGFIGVGGRGFGDLQAIHKSPGVKVTALCDINGKNLNRAAEHVADDGPKLFEDYRDLVAFKGLDAVFIATPCYLHAEMAIAVLDSGRHCYLEKPMAITMKDLNAVHAATRRSKGILQIGTQLRYASPWKPTLEAITSGKVGKPILVRAFRNNAGNFPGNGWFVDPVKSGDVMLEQAVHEFDIFNAIFQGVPRRGAGFGGQALRESVGPMHDHFTLCLDYGENQQVGYTHSWLAARDVGCDGMNEFVYCVDGTVDIHGGHIYHREAKIVKKSAVGTQPAEMTNREDVPRESKGDSTQLAVDDFFRCCRKGERPLANADTGRDAVLVGLLCRKALAEGRVVTMDEVLAEA
ncbi:MAG: Gfo/Idh/MocA family oxidoreductase [Planctomycetes bacterium]|nr:Gfo/Idh/MocA family oxidoreductase [Planctomycetota bacterium]